MFNVIKGLTVDEYLKTYDEEKNVKHNYFADIVNNSHSLNELIKKANKDFNVIMFSEAYCPDCLILFPFIKFLNDKMGINVKILKKQGNEDALRELTGDARIPTVLFINIDNTLRGMIIEFPQEFKNKLIGLSMDEMKQKISPYRDGKYIELIEREIINIVDTKGAI